MLICNSHDAGTLEQRAHNLPTKIPTLGKSKVPTSELPRPPPIPVLPYISFMGMYPCEGYGF